MGHAPKALLRDEALAGLAAKGDRAAFDVLFSRHRARLLRCTRAILRDDHDAQDALQTTALKALGGLPRRRPGVPVRPWLIRIAANESISMLRRRRTRADTSLAEAPARPSDGPYEQTIVRAELALLLDDLTRLSEGQRTALLLRHVAGADYDEIAATLHTTPIAARRAVSTARGNLAALASGRDADCDGVRLTIAAGDRRALRSLSVGAHLRTCRACRELAGPSWRDRAAALVPVLPGGLIAALRGLAMPATSALPDGAGAPLAKGFAAVAALAVGLTVAPSSSPTPEVARVTHRTVHHVVAAHHATHHVRHHAAPSPAASATTRVVSAVLPRSVVPSAAVVLRPATHVARSTPVSTTRHARTRHATTRHHAHRPSDPGRSDAVDQGSGSGSGPDDTPTAIPVADHHPGPSPSASAPAVREQQHAQCDKPVGAPAAAPQPRSAPAAHQWHTSSAPSPTTSAPATAPSAPAVTTATAPASTTPAASEPATTTTTTEPTAATPTTTGAAPLTPAATTPADTAAPTAPADTPSAGT